MNITITARKTSVRDSFRERIEKKLAKLDRFFDENANAIVTVTNEGDRETVEAVFRTITTDDAIDCLDRAGLRGPVMASLARELDLQLKRRAGEGMEIEAIFFSNRFGILGRTPGAEKLAARHPAAEA